MLTPIKFKAILLGCLLWVQLLLVSKNKFGLMRSLLKDINKVLSPVVPTPPVAGQLFLLDHLVQIL